MEFEDIYALVRDTTLIDAERCRVIFEHARKCLELTGEFWECGVFKGGSAKILAELIRPNPRPLRIFDTFLGFPGFDRSIDTGKEVSIGHFGDTSLFTVMNFLDVPFLNAYQGPIPETFRGLEESQIAFAHIDVDLYQPTRDALAFVLPRMLEGGVIVIDDYEHPDWPGVGKAVNQLIEPGRMIRSHRRGIEAQGVFVA